MDPRDNLGYLLHHLASTLDRQSDQILLERLGIGFSQYKILMALKWHANVQQRFVAEYLGQTEASISRQIKLLADKGLVQTRTSPTNRRERITSLSGKGDRLVDAASSALNHYHAPVFNKLNEKQQKQLAESLMILHDCVCQPSKKCGCNH